LKEQDAVLCDLEVLMAVVDDITPNKTRISTLTLCGISQVTEILIQFIQMQSANQQPIRHPAQ
jgi:heme/copper-type cytochrome/quinol oxidase subunit 4